MKQRLRVLSILWVLALLSRAEAQTVSPRVDAGHAAAGARPIDGQALISRSRQTLARQTSIEAKIRQQIDLFGQQLVGNGAYLQQSTETEMLVRLELKIQTASKIGSLLQVADRRYLWTERRLNDHRTVSQVDLRKVRSVWKQRSTGFSQPATGLLVGGLNELLAGIAENFEFSSVRETTLSNVPVYELTGRLSQQSLAKMFPQKKKKKGESGKPISLDQLPPQVPHQVILMLGRDDLFPYVVDFRRGAGGQGNSNANSGKSIVRMQLFEVRIGGAIDSRQFVYKPGAVEVTDGTAKFLQAYKRRESLNR